MANNVYRGRRYVPKLMGAWDNTNKTAYEPLSIVEWGECSYTSKIDVPVGIDILNTKYWVCTGNYNAQVELYRREVRELENNVASNTEQIQNNANEIQGARKGEITLENKIDVIDNGILSNKEKLDKVEFYPVLITEIGVTDVRFKYGDVRRYGAVNSDKIDSGEALQNAINSYPYVTIPFKGTVYTKRTLYLNPNSEIIGCGLDTRIFTDLDIPIFNNKEGVVRCDGVVIRDLTIYKHYSNSVVEALNLTDISHSTLDNVYIIKTGTNSVGSVGLKLGNNTPTSNTYYNTFHHVKISGFDVGIDIGSSSNANMFTSCVILRCRVGCIIDKTNSLTFIGTGFELLTEDGIIVKNSSLYNNFIACRFESCRKSIVIPYSATVPSFRNYVVGMLDYSTEGSDYKNSSNIIVDKDSKILTNVEYNYIKNKTFVDTYVGVTKPVLPLNVWTKIPYDKKQKDINNEFDVTTNSMTVVDDGVYSISANLLLKGSASVSKNVKLALFIDDVIEKVISIKSVFNESDIFINGNITTYLEKGKSIDIRVYSDMGVGISYDYTVNRLNISRL